MYTYELNQFTHKLPKVPYTTILPKVLASNRRLGQHTMVKVSPNSLSRARLKPQAPGMRDNAAEACDSSSIRIDWIPNTLAKVDASASI